MWYTFYEIIYYTVIYFILSMIFGICIDELFPKLDKKKINHIILGEMVLQTIVIVMATYFIYYIGEHAMKYSFIKKGVHSLSQQKIELTGDIVVALIFLSTQDNYINKINHLQEYVRELVFKN